MLNRILEPEVMDSIDEAIDYNAMDHAAVNRLFAADFLIAARNAGLLPINADASSESDDDEPAPWLDILDLGAGTAQIPIEVCRQSDRVRVVAIDLAMQMLYLARNNVEI